MKKVLSLVLAFAMILGSFGFVFASDFPDVKDTEYFSEPVNVLSGFGVIGGFPDGTFGPEKEVTRAQMATMIVNALGMTVNGQSDTKFSDVPKSHWASGFIAYATSVGFVAGYPDGTFKPDASVTYDQALTMIVAALGYSAESLPGTWPGSFVNKAQGLGLLEICKTTGTTNAPRQDIACFLYKALNQPIGYTDKDGAFNANRGKDGIVGSDTMIARLGGDVYNNGLAFVYDGSQPTAVNMSKYLGAFITAYMNNDGDIVAIKEVLSEFVEGAYKAADKTVDGKKFESATKLALPGAGDKWTGSYVGFENGEVKAAVSDWTYAADSVKVAVKLNGSKVTTVYSVQVWNADDVMQADDEIQDTIKDDKAFGTLKFPLDSEDEIDTTEFELLGRNSLSEIAEDDILTIYANSKKIITKLEVGTEKVEGKITKIDKDGNCTIGGTAYGVDAFAAINATKAAALDVDDEGTFFLTYAGDIYEFEPVDDTSTNYAVLLSTGTQAGKYNGNDAYFANLFLADGTEKEFEVKSLTVLTAAGLAAKADYGRLVKYTVNSSNKITALQAVALGTGATFDKNGITGGIKLKSDTVAFEFVGAAADFAKADSYKVLDVTKLYDETVTQFAKLDDGKGTFTAVLVTGLSGSSTEVAIFVDFANKTSDGYAFTALYEGEVKDIVCDEDYRGALIYVKTSPVSVAYYTLSFDSNNVVNTTPAAASATDTTIDMTTSKSSVSGSVLTVGTTNYSFDKEAKVYVYDVSDDEWKPGTMDSLAAKKAGNITSITLVKVDADAYYDIALVVKP